MRSLAPLVLPILLPSNVAVGEPLPQRPLLDRVERLMVEQASTLGLIGTPSRATTVHEDPAIGTVLSVSFAFDREEVEGEVEVLVYASVEAAAADAGSALRVPEAQVEDGTYNVTIRSFSSGKRPRTGTEIAVRCATRALGAGAVSQIRCAEAPAGSQAVIVTRTDGEPIGHMLALDGCMLAMLPVTNAVAEKVEQAEAAR